MNQRLQEFNTRAYTQAVKSVQICLLYQTQAQAMYINELFWVKIYK